MKSNMELIQHLKSNPLYKDKLSQYLCFDTLLRIIPKRFVDDTKYVYAKGETIYFAISNKHLSFEFNINKMMFELLLSDAKKHTSWCKGYTTIKSFVAKQEVAQEVKDDFYNEFYEKSKGEFENPFTNQKLKNECEKIREILYSK